MQNNIGNFNYRERIKRDNLSSYIKGLIDKGSSVGLHAIGFTKDNKTDIASKISTEGLKIYNNLTIYSTVRFFGELYFNDDELNHYRYDQTDNKELVIVLAIPEKFVHSSGSIVIGGDVPALSVSEAKKATNEFIFNYNESDRVFKPVPKEMILGCYTFDKTEEKKTLKSKPVQKTRYNPYTERYEYYTSPEYYYEYDLGHCDFYENPYYYGRLSQEERDEFITKYFGHKLKLGTTDVKVKKLSLK